MSTRVTLWMDDLLDPARVSEAGAELKNQLLPSLKTLLTKADYHYTKPKSFEAQASHLFHQTSTLPFAATSAFGLGVLPDEQHSWFWLQLSPVQVVPDRDTLVLIPSEQLGITQEESLALVACFNQHFAQDGLKLIYGAVDQWFLSLPQTIDLQTTPLAQVSFQSLQDKFPSGAAGNYWRQLLNETQMLFYTHPVNEARRENNLPEINSVWVWGEGSLFDIELNKREQTQIMSHHPYLKGMAKLTHADLLSPVQSYSELSGMVGKHTLIRLEHEDWFSLPIEQVTLSQWLDGLERLEQQWFLPMYEAMMQGDIDSLLLVLGATKTYHIQPKHLKRFWRWKKQWFTLVN